MGRLVLLLATACGPGVLDTGELDLAQLGQPVVLPDAPTTADTLHVVLQDGWEDVDGLAFAWFVDTARVAEGEQLAPGTAPRGASVHVTVSVPDQPTVGARSSDKVVLRNAAPVFEGLDLAPAAPRTDDVLTATPVVIDADGDPITLAYVWTVSDSSTTVVGNALSGADWFDAGDRVHVVVTASDAYGGAVTRDASLAVANTACG